MLFGFATSVAQTLPVIGSSVSPDIISMIPYIVTILAVAGFVGKVRAPPPRGCLPVTSPAGPRRADQ